MTTRVVLHEPAIAGVERDLATGAILAGSDLYRLALDLTPVRSGRLRAATFAVVYLDGATRWSAGPVPAGLPVQGVGVELFVGNGADYAGHVNFGTEDTEAQPFLTEARARIMSRLPALFAGGRGRS